MKSHWKRVQFLIKLYLTGCLLTVFIMRSSILMPTTTKLIFAAALLPLYLNVSATGAEVKMKCRMPELGDADFPRPSPSARHDQKVKVARDGSYDVVLVGDSITHTLGELGGKYGPMKDVWNRHFAPLNAINLGHNGYRTEQILWNLQNGELDFKRAPKVVMLLIGTNNTDDRHFKKSPHR